MNLNFGLGPKWREATGQAGAAGQEEEKEQEEEEGEGSIAGASCERGWRGSAGGPRAQQSSSPAHKERGGRAT